MSRLLSFAAGIEAATGVALIADPSFVGRLLFGVELTGVPIAVGRVAGIGLLSLGLACWPRPETTRTALCAILTYNLLVALYLLSLRHPRRMGRASLVACGCVTRCPDGATHTVVVQGAELVVLPFARF